MTQINQIIIEGNVVRDSQVKETPRGTKVCLISLATNRYYKDAKGAYQKETGYFDVEAWGETFCSRVIKNARKGTGLRVVGRLKQDRWKGADGKNASKVSIIAEHIDFKVPPSSDSINSDENTEEKNSAKEAADGIKSEITDSGDELVF